MTDELAYATQERRPIVLAARVAQHCAEHGGSWEDIAAEVYATLLQPTDKMLKEAAKAMSPGRRPTPDRVSWKQKHRIRFRAMIIQALAE